MLCEDCYSKAAKGRKICYTCKSRRWRLQNDLQYCYATLRNNAKRRGVAFELTIEQFELFCNRTSYLQFRGVMADDFTIDRIRSSEGYNINNIQILTLSNNVKKARKEKNIAVLKRRAVRAPDDVF